MFKTSTTRPSLPAPIENAGSSHESLIRYHNAAAACTGIGILRFAAAPQPAIVLLLLLGGTQPLAAQTVNVTTPGSLTAATGTSSPANGAIWNLQSTGISLSNTVTMPTGTTGLTINGNGNTLTLNNGGGVYGRFTSAGGDVTLNLSDVSLTGGVQTNVDGSVISNGTGSISINTTGSVTFADNHISQSLSGQIEGGAVLSRGSVTLGGVGASITLSGNQITNSSSSGLTEGGAIYSGKSTTVSGSKITATGNQVSGPDAKGGAFFSGGFVTLGGDGSTITLSDNQASGLNLVNGGAVYALGPVTLGGVGASITLSGNQITNSSSSGVTQGGAIYSGKSTTVSGSKITATGNQVRGPGARGGVIFSSGSVILGDVGSTVTISDNRASNSLGNAQGGAIYSGQDVTIFGSEITLSGNRAGGDSGSGSAIYSLGSVSLGSAGSAITLSNNKTENGWDGAVHSRGSVTIGGDGSTIRLSNNQSTHANDSTRGGAIYSGGSVTLGGVGSTITLSDNWASGGYSGGGAIWANGGVTLGGAGSVIKLSGNQASSEGGINSGGGAIVNIAGGNVSIAGFGEISNNAATTGDGGAIATDIAGSGNSAVMLTASGGGFLVAGNQAGGRGGAIYVNAGTIDLEATDGNITFSGNTQNTSGTRQANAIYVNNAGGGSQVTLNATAGNAITLFDPIQNNAANGLTTMTKTGDGSAIFDGSLYINPTDQWSQVYGTTVVQSGTFAVRNNAVYGVLAADVAQTAPTSFTVNSGATLAGGLAGEVRTDNFTLNGILNIAGSALPGSASGGFSIFTVNSNNVGLWSGSHLLFNTYLNDASVQRTDLLTLNLNGNATSGTANVVVTNAGGPGAVTTGNGIELVRVANNNGTTAGAFRLTGPLVAGPYEYTLFHGSIDASGPQNWYLRSTLNCALAPSLPECQQPTPAPPTRPNFRVETSVYSALPSMALLYGRNLLDTLHQRVGDEEDIRGRRNLNQWAPNTGAWGRVIGAHGKQNADALGIYGSGPQYNYDFVGLQAGQDLFRYEHADGSRDHGGVYFAYGNASGTVTHFDGMTGSNKFNAYTLGGYWTHFGATGWYVDSVLQGTRYDATSTANRGLPSLTPDGNGVAVSIEGGQPFKFAGGWFVEPQAQLIYQAINFGGTSDTKAQISFTNVDSLAARIGARFGLTWSLDNDAQGGRLLTVWIRPNLWREFRGNPLTRFSEEDGTVPFRADLRGNWGEINLGASGQVDHNTTLFANASYHARFDSKGYAYNGKIGFRINW